MPQLDASYTTLELDVASYLFASGFPLINARQGARGMTEFTFPSEASEIVPEYIAGHAISARVLLEANRQLRNIIRMARTQVVPYGTFTGIPQQGVR
jgi:hypothetical protein